MSTGLLIGCESEEDNKVAMAQACLDSASGTQAAECMHQVDGIESAEASRIRCGGVYMMRGFGLTTFKNAYNQLKNPTSGGDPILGLVSFVAFDTTIDSFTGLNGVGDSSYLMSECGKAGAPGLVWLAFMTQFGSLVVADGGATVTIGDPTTWSAADLAGISATTVGNSALTVYNGYCKTGTAASSPACTEINAAVAAAGTDPAALGAQIKTMFGTVAPGS